MWYHMPAHPKKGDFMRMLNKCLFVVGTCVAAVAVHGAEWLGTGGDTLWGNADNWQSSTGVPTGNIAISATAGRTPVS